MRKRLAKIEFALFLTCTLVGASAALTAVGAPAAGSNAELSEVLLSTSFEETWVLDEDGDYKAPPGWDVDGICVGYQDELYQWLTHYWSDLTDTESLPAFDLSHSGVTSACVWWSNGYGESEMVGTRQSEWLITPTLDLSRYASVNLSFWSIYCWDPLYSNNSNYVKISVDNGGSWETIADLTHEARWRLGGDLPDWENWNCYQYPINIDLSQYVGEPLVKIAWHYQFPGEGGHAIWVVDDVKVSGVPDVTPPFGSIEKPGKAFYFNDKEVFPFFTPLVIG
ncbi:MAG TPA: hypothetical protein ENI42_02785, partial [Thermoplasmatales archaeon]|nr:hypothetical protein [Thermoplasmatales archaeon]